MSWPTPPNAGAAAGNYDALLGGGRSTPSASFRGQFPIRWEGFIEDAAKKPAYEYDPSKPGNRGAQKFWQDGNPVENLWVTLRTEVRDPSIEGDNGYRVLVLDSKNKIDAVQDAVRESGASFAKNGYLVLEWYGNDPNGKNPDNPPKLYRARYQGPTLDAALGVQQAPPTPAAQAPAWGQQQPAAAPAAPATGGWGSPPVQQAQGAPAWGAQPAAPATTPAASPTAATAGGWGVAAPAPAPAAWSEPVPVAPPAPAPSAIDPGLLEALRKKGVNPPPGATMQQAVDIWAVVQHQPDTVA